MTKAFELTYKDKKVEIHIADYVGEVRNIEGTPDLFSLSYRSDMNDKGQYLLATEAEINIYEDAYFNIDELKTVGETDILIKYFEDADLVWQGFVLPDFFQTGITKVRVLRMIATDRLGVLKDIVNTSVSNTPKEIIEQCLLQTGLSLPVEIRNNNTYLETTTINRERIEGISAYDIIRSFMVQFNSKIVQYKNKWWVVNKKLLEDGFLGQEIIDIDLVYLDGQREIKPTASEVSLYLEYGGSRRYPNNALFREWNGGTDEEYNIGNFSNWTSNNGAVQYMSNRRIIKYERQGGTTAYIPQLANDTTSNSLIIGTGMVLAWNKEHDYTNTKNIATPTIPMTFKEGVSEIKIKISTVSAGLTWLQVVPLIKIKKANSSNIDYFAIGNDGVVGKVGSNGYNLKGVEPIKTSNANVLDATTASLIFEETFTVTLDDVGAQEDSLEEHSMQLLFFGQGFTGAQPYSAVFFINSVEVSFNDNQVTGKGLIFKTKQGGDKFSKVRETETTLFSDKINQGVNGYFYNYKYDDTSITNLPKEYLLQMTRQMADMFCSARDFYSFNGKFKVNPLARYRCGSKYFVLVGGQSKRKTASIEIEEIVSNEGLTRTDYIYTYFEDSKDNIKSIGTASGSGGAGGTGGGGGMTSSQLEMLTNLADWWRLDEENDAIYSLKSVYSLKGVSALGLGSGGGGGGGDFDRLDAWVDYDSTKAGWVLSALLGKDLDTRVNALQSGSATNIEISGSGNAVTGVSKDGNTLTFAKGSTFSLSTHTHLISQVTGLQSALDLKATQSDIDTAIDGIEIGGRNLAHLTNSKEWEIYSGGTISFGEYRGITTIKSTDNGSGYIGIQQGSNARKMLLRAGEQYTISLLVRGTVPLDYNFIMNTGSANRSIGNFTYEQPLNEETFVKAYLKITGSSNFELSTGSYFMTRPTVINEGDWVEITQLKIEKGNKPTGWTPAPEDQVSDWSTTDVTSFSYIKNKPTTLSGYGITDAVTTNTTQTITGAKTFSSLLTANAGISTSTLLASGIITATGGNSTNWNKAYADSHTHTNKAQLDVIDQELSMDSSVGFNSAYIDNNIEVGGLINNGKSFMYDDLTMVEGDITTPAINIGGNWSIELSGTELVFKHNGVIKQRMLSDGTILATSGITALSTE